VDRVVDLYFIFDIFVNLMRPITDAARGIDIIHLADIQ